MPSKLFDWGTTRLVVGVSNGARQPLQWVEHRARPLRGSLAWLRLRSMSIQRFNRIRRMEADGAARACRLRYMSVVEMKDKRPVQALRVDEMQPRNAAFRWRRTPRALRSALKSTQRIDLYETTLMTKNIGRCAGSCRLRCGRGDAFRTCSFPQTTRPKWPVTEGVNVFGMRHY